MWRIIGYFLKKVGYGFIAAIQCIKDICFVLKKYFSYIIYIYVLTNGLITLKKSIKVTLIRSTKENMYYNTVVYIQHWLNSIWNR